MALRISRKKNQALLIGDDITVFISNVRGDEVVLGIDAPEDVKIMRREQVAHKPKAEKLKAPIMRAAMEKAGIPTYKPKIVNQPKQPSEPSEYDEDWENRGNK